MVAGHNVGRTDTTGTRMKLGEGAMGHVAVSREPLIIDGYRDWAGQSAQYAQVEFHGGAGGAAPDRRAAGGRHRGDGQGPRAGGSAPRTCGC